MKSEGKKNASASRREQSKFMDELAMFMKANVCYTLKRLLPADLKVTIIFVFPMKYQTLNIYFQEIYTQHSPEESKLPFNPFIESYEMTPNTTKGGYNVTDNVVYGW